MKTSFKDISPFITKDGSTIRELMHPASHGNLNQSLAEAVVNPGQKTQTHKHIKSEEIYHITQGRGVMSLDGEGFDLETGDTVLIRPDGAPSCR